MSNSLAQRAERYIFDPVLDERGKAYRVQVARMVRFFFFALVFFYFRSLHFCPFPPKIILQTEMFNSPLNAKPKDVYENLSCYTSFPCFNTTLFFLSFLTYFTVRKHCPFSSKHYRPQLAST